MSARAAQVFREYGLTEAQFNVLFTLDIAEESVTQADLGKRLVVTRASITSVLDKMEAKGLVERRNVEGNRRIYHIVLTEAGRTLFEAVKPRYEREIHAVLGGMDEAACRTLIEALEMTRGRVREMLSNGDTGRAG